MASSFLLWVHIHSCFQCLLLIFPSKGRFKLIFLLALFEFYLKRNFNIHFNIKSTWNIFSWCMTYRNKVWHYFRAVIEAATGGVLWKKRPWHRCFPVNFAKFLRTSFLQNTSGRLLLLHWLIKCQNFQVSIWWQVWRSLS